MGYVAANHLGEPWSAPDDQARADIAAGLSQAMSAMATNQAESAAFITEHGAKVLPGHSPVNAPGRQGDPDPTLDASD
jgi:hypothetical protein